MLSLIIAALLNFQSVSVSPNLVEIPATNSPYARWPDFESDPRVGYETFTIKYNVGPAGFPKDGKLQFMLGYFTDHLNVNNPVYGTNFGWMQVPTDATSQSPIGRPQIKTPAAANYTTVSCPFSTFKRRMVTRVNNAESILEIQANSNIPANTYITVTFGDKVAGGPGASISWMPGRPKVVVFEDSNNDSVWNLANATMPEILFTGADADSFIVSAPMFSTLGNSQLVTVMAMQGRDDTPESFMCPVEDFNDNINITCSDPLAVLPTSLPQSSWQYGCASFNVTFLTPGYHFIKIGRVGLPSTVSFSNTVFVDVQTPYTIFCGDLQRHSSEGGHASTPDIMTWNRLADRNDSFGCVVQHSEYSFAGFAGANAARDLFQSTLDPLESRFIAFPGYEWGLPGNHRHVVFKNSTSQQAIADNPYGGGETPSPVIKSTVDDFLSYLTSQSDEKIAIAHHTLWNKSDFPDEPYDWAQSFMENTQPLVEIYSKHGCSERFFYGLGHYNYVMKHDVSLQRPLTEAASVADALVLGYKIGIVGGSDEHSYISYYSGSGQGDYTRPGLGFVVTRDPVLSRNNIWTALRRKNTYATTGAKIHLLFTGNNRPNGSTIHDSTCNFRIVAHSSCTNASYVPNINRVRIYRDGYNLVLDQQITPKLRYIDINWTDPAPLNDNREHSYFVKIYQDDAHLAWSSPIWWLKL